MSTIFGTDGVRGVANRDLTAELAFKLGRAGAHVLARGNGRGPVVIGRDTRISGDMLEAALKAGILSAGMDVLDAGVLPTPGVAFLTRELGAVAGAVISASHNPVEDNGIKFFGASGYKLSDELEEEISGLVTNSLAGVASPEGGSLGRVYRVEDAVARYVDYAAARVPVPACGLKVVVDCANGAAFQAAPAVLNRFLRGVTAINDRPDGVNINHRCGSTHPEELCRTVVDAGADLGFALDGDADRVLACDSRGRLVDGDRIMYLLARYFRDKGLLALDTVVVTVMSNLGLHLALRQDGFAVRETKVGDRYVLEDLLHSGARFGGEQSGHIIHLDFNTTGDGILTMLHILKAVAGFGQPLDALVAGMEQLPQMMENVSVADKAAVMASGILAAAVERQEKVLAGQGRVLVRPSGTEPLVRVMAEARDEALMRRVVAELVAVVKDADREVVRAGR
ncbi:MAG TPA: phosphoglucosamine mutase [Spirochaetia bacterium]|nr:phosphoglucosamine mutase [Spirochaetia bacterium]